MDNHYLGGRKPDSSYAGVGFRVKGWLARRRTVAVALVAVLAVPRSVAAEREVHPFINRIVIRGNHGVSTGELKKQMRSKEPSFFAIFNRPRYSEAFVRRDIGHLEGYYHSAGFFEARVMLDRIEYTEDSRFVDIYIEINEGSPTIVESISFSPGALIDVRDLRRGLFLVEGAHYNASLLDTDIYTLKSRYFNRGYLAVAISDSTRVEGRRVHISYGIEPGTEIRIGDIQISGTRDVRSSVVEKEFTFKRGEVCRLEKLIDTQRNLFETGLFTVADVTPTNLDPMERTVDVVVRVRERKPSYIETGFGVGNVVGTRLSAEWGTRNLFGTGRLLRARAEYDYDLFRGESVDLNNLGFQNIFYRYDLTFQQRRVFGTKLNLALETFLEKDASVENLVIRTVGGTISGQRRFGRNIQVRSGFTVEEIDRTSFAGKSEQSKSHILGTSASHDMRDFVLNPHEGFYRIVHAQVAGGALGGRNDFYTLTVSDQRYYHAPFSSVLGWRMRVGYGEAYGRSAQVPIENRYFLGGGNSVRGYNENVLGPIEVDGAGRDAFVGGQFLLLGNVEWRFPLPLLARWNFGGSLFADGGNVWRNADRVSWGDFRVRADAGDVGVDDFRYSVGVGVRYNTPIGPIRLDYGHPLKRDNYLADQGRFHFTLGQIF